MTNRPGLVLLIAWLVASSGASSLIAQSLEPAAPIGRGPAPVGFDCTAEALNIGGFVGSDGSVAVFNVPADQGRLRLRLTCEDALGSLFGESPLIDLAPGDAAWVDEILFDGGTPIASGLRITPADARLEGVGQVLQLQVTGDRVDGSTVDLAPASTGTTYVSSNPAIASVDADGRVVLHDSGTVLITAANEGVLGFARVTGLAASIASLDLAPTSIELVANRLFPTPIEPLTLTATLSDGAQVDLSSAESGTQWASSAPAIASVDADGRVFGLSSGSATITATRGGSSVQATVEVAEFTPTPVLAVDTPGYASNLDIDGAMLFVADGSAGLQFYDSAGSAAIPGFDPGGSAFDVRVRDGLAAVAMGVDGIALVDVTDVTAPSLLATVPTPSATRDVWLSSDRLVAALGSDGLGVWDVSDPVAPALVGLRAVGAVVTAVSTDAARGVTVALTSSPSLVVLAEQGSVASWPAVTVPLPSATNRASDVVLLGDAAWVANGRAGIHKIDVDDPTAPVRTDDTSLNFNALGVAARQTDDGLLVAGADNIFINAVPLFDASLRNVQNVDFSDFSGAVLSDANSDGVALGDGFGAVAVGSAGIQIFRWRRPVDNGGVAPTVSLGTPIDGTWRMPDQRVLVAATAVDDVAVERVEFQLDGEPLAVDASPPYRASFVTGPDGTVHTVQARAVDLAGHWSPWTAAVTLTSSTEAPLTCMPAPADLVAWYPFAAEEPDDAVEDLAGGPSGSLFNGASSGDFAGIVVGDERLEGALRLDGGNDYVAVESHAAIEFGTGDFSIEAWIKTTDSQAIIVSKRSLGNVGYLFMVYHGKLLLQLGDTARRWYNFYGGPQVRNGEWRHVAVTVDRDQTDGGRLYLDGETVHTFNPTIRSGDTNNGVALQIGRTIENVAYYNGLIDEVSLYSRALSSEEIASVFAFGSDGKCPP